jgi:hypothetical protein
MIIRPALETDIEGAIDLLREFQSESLNEYGVKIDIDIAKQTCMDYVKTSLVAEIDNKIVGVLAGTVINAPLGKDLIYQEAVWFVSKKYRKVGIKLLASLEEYCKNKNIKFIIFVHMMNLKKDKLEDFYLRLGFIPFEVHYIKELRGN